MKTALITGNTGITGITGHDGSYLEGLLLDKGYPVAGMVRRLSLANHAHRAHRQPGRSRRGRPARPGLAHEHPAGVSAGRVLQPGVDELPAHILETAGSHGGTYGTGCDTRARGCEDCESIDSLFPGLEFRDVR